ncbi:putative nuclease HARBI1 [Tanacetum coccineum]|uniref:Nuclease HARBI1 n=1 Tax=Tanacetum coccineum TaxID=301880 RepID=A0ABQ5B3L2_9ASTR
MNQNNEDRQLSVFEIDANDDETDVVFLEQAYAYHQQLVAEENHLPLTRNPINRDREGAEERLMADYFNDHCRYPKTYFRRRYRMRRKLFLKIVKCISTYEADPLPDHFNFFRVRPDATGRMSLSVIMKCTAAIRQLAYGTTPDAFDEYLQMSERTARNCLFHFNKCIISLYMVEYLRKPTVEDVENIYNKHLTTHGFPGMLGSIDCMHWEWKNCPVSWQGQYGRGDKKLLDDFISSRDVFRTVMNLSSTVADVLGSGSLVWPHELEIKYPILLSIPSPRLSQGVHDKLEWRSRLGSIKPFAVNTVWQAIRPRDIKVAWVDAVWFPNCIPRHAFNLWLIIRRKLKTQDSLRSWDISSSLDLYCVSSLVIPPDSHEHLFFACPFSLQVWFHMPDMAGLSHLPPLVDVILDDIVPMANRRTSKSVISKLVLSASAYFIWLERNDRLFKGNKRTAAQVIDCVMSTIRLKLMSCRFKKSKVGLDLMQRWKLPEVLLI